MILATHCQISKIKSCNFIERVESLLWYSRNHHNQKFELLECTCLCWNERKRNCDKVICCKVLPFFSPIIKHSSSSLDNSNDSCIGWKSCRSVDNGIIMDDSCQGSQACYALQGTVSEGSCQEASSCKDSGRDSVIGQHSCNSEFGCVNNVAEIGDCTCNTPNKNACENNTSPISPTTEFCPSEVSSNTRDNLMILFYQPLIVSQP